jgi:hypothetical protein
VGNQGDPLKIEVFDKLQQVGNPLFQCEGILVFIGFIRQSATEVIDGDAPKPISEGRNQTSPKIRPRGIAVDH